MILVYANLLVYAKVTSFPQHAAARAWFDERLGGEAKVGLPWESLTAFVRIVTNPRLFPTPLPTAAAAAQVREWLACGPVWSPVPTDGHVDALVPLLALDGVRGDLVADAHLAAMAMCHGLTLMTNDSDFARFPGLRWENPLVA